MILDYILAETLNGLTMHAGHAAAVEFLNRAEENTRFYIDSLTADEFSTAKSPFRQHERFSLVDARGVAYIQVAGLGNLYRFGEDFDATNAIYRLDIPTNPYQPE